MSYIYHFFVLLSGLHPRLCFQMSSCITKNPSSWLCKLKLIIMLRFLKLFHFSNEFITCQMLRWISNGGVSPLQPLHRVCESSRGVWCLGGCWCFSKAPDPSGALFDLGLCSPVLEQPAQIQRCECSAAQSKRVNQPFDLLYKKYGKYGKESVLRRNFKRSMKGGKKDLLHLNRVFFRQMF